MIYGVKKAKTDIRDYKIKSSLCNIAESELRHLPKVKNQGQVNSCAAHASSSILEWFNETETGKYNELSTDFIYGMQGVALNEMNSGMYLRDVCKIVKNYGDTYKKTIPTNYEMPFCAENLKEILSESIYEEASMHKVKSYAKCDTDENIKYALLSYGPVLASVKWYDKYTLENNVICFDTQANNGYHAVMVYGFNDKGWLCQNSWGTNWGDEGRFILPYDYGICEAWSFVDADNPDIHKPKKNIFYKLINWIINFLSKKLKIE